MKRKEENFSLSILHDENKINQILKKISLKKPLTNFQFFLKTKFNEIFPNGMKKDIIKNDENQNYKDFFIKCIKHYSNKWNEMTQKEKNKYKINIEKEKNNYKRNFIIINTFIFKGIHGEKLKKPTDYRLFLNINLINGLFKGTKEKIIKRTTRNIWKKINHKNKKYYKAIKKNNDIFLEKAIKFKRITPLTLYIKELNLQIKENISLTESIKKLRKKWEKLPPEEQNIYKIRINNDRVDEYKYKDIYDLINGYKSRLSKSAYHIFLKEKMRINEINNLKEGKQKWKILSNEEKEKYKLIYHRCKLAHIYNNILYKKKVKKYLPKKPGGPVQIFIKEKKGIKIPTKEKLISYWSKQYTLLTEEKKKEYMLKSDKARIEYEAKLREFRNKKFEKPKRPLYPFIIYLIEKYKEIKINNPYLDYKYIITKIASNWKEGKNINKKKYEDMANEQKLLYKYKLHEYKMKGFYSNNININNL